MYASPTLIRNNVVKLRDGIALAMSDIELQVLDAVAAQHGITREEAASRLVSAGMAKRLKKRTGFAAGARVSHSKALRRALCGEKHSQNSSKGRCGR